MKGGSILVTGCSSGIGFRSAVFLAEKGYTVFAGVRREPDVRKLISQGMANLVPVFPLDLTNPGQIKEAEAFVREELEKRSIEGLSALVNNAGGGFIAPLELADTGALRTEFETRIIGPVGMIQAFLPLLREAPGTGRIIWINTPALLPIPFDSSIHAPDFAVNCIIRTLRNEFGFRIPVIMIRCGVIKTEAVERSYHELEENLKIWPPEKLSYYAEALGKIKQNFELYDKKRTDPVEVAKIIEKAVSDIKPRKKYRVGHLSLLSGLLENLPQDAIDALMPKA